jgi:hypothetical protein
MSRDIPDWRVAFEQRQAARRATQAGTAPCVCGHPKDRHVKFKDGIYWQCQWWYGRGDGKCKCGGYRPQQDGAA